MHERRRSIGNILSVGEGDDSIEAKITSQGNSVQINVLSGGTVNFVTYTITSKVVIEEAAQSDLSWPESRRAQVFRMCHGIAKQYSLYQEMRAVMWERWGAKSMRELSDSALQSLLCFLRAQERHKQGKP